MEIGAPAFRHLAFAVQPTSLAVGRSRPENQALPEKNEYDFLEQLVRLEGAAVRHTNAAVRHLEVVVVPRRVDVRILASMPVASRIPAVVENLLQYPLQRYALGKTNSSFFADRDLK